MQAPGRLSLDWTDPSCYLSAWSGDSNAMKRWS